jgi:cell wall-associated NlpC family hydrolase
VQNVYFRNGIVLSRDASLQALHGLDVDISNGWSELQKGDLLFFGSIRDSKPRVTHVAIYKGDGDYIHASGMVRVNSFDSAKANYSDSRTSSLLLAKRIIGNNSDGIVAVKDHQLY